jgi:hypothetical protein
MSVAHTTCQTKKIGPPSGISLAFSTISLIALPIGVLFGDGGEP